MQRLQCCNTKTKIKETKVIVGMEEKKHAPVGVFDSGVGGLTVAREIMRQLPGENVVYFGDTARVPYGSKSKNNIIRFVSYRLTGTPGILYRTAGVSGRQASHRRRQRTARVSATPPFPLPRKNRSRVFQENNGDPLDFIHYTWYNNNVL